MKKRTRSILGLVAICALPACAPKGMIHVSEVSPLYGVIEKRHDTYVQNDDTLSGEEKTLYLTQSRLLGSVFDEAEGVPDGQ